MIKQISFLPLLNYLELETDPYVVGHATRMEKLAEELAIAAGFHNDTVEMENIKLGTSLHDIGKLVISEQIRRQVGAYTPGERNAMQEHPIKSAEILTLSMNGDINPEIVLIAKHHHEKWNGKGYPDGLEGMQIPLGARIVTICDHFDAMTHDRGYRHALTEQDALQVMTDEQIAGPIYDPTLLRLFFELRKAKAMRK